MRAMFMFASLLLTTFAGSPTQAEKLTLETTPFRIQMARDVFILIGGSLDVNRIGFLQDRITLDADFKVYTRKRDLEDFVFQQIKSSKPINLYYLIDIQDVYGVSIDPQSDGFHVGLDAEIGNKWTAWRDRVTAVIDSKSLVWAVSQSIIRVVPQSLHFQYPAFFKWVKPEMLIESRLQKYINENIDKKNIRALMPAKMDLSDLAFAYDKASTQIAIKGHFQAQFDKSAFEAQFAGILADHFGAVGQGESAGLQNSKPRKPSAFKVVGQP